MGHSQIEPREYEKYKFIKIAASIKMPKSRRNCENRGNYCKKRATWQATKNKQIINADLLLAK